MVRNMNNKCSVKAGLSGAGFATTGSAPWEPVTRASPWCADAKASEHWIVCCIPVMSRQAYLPLPVVRAFGQRFRPAYLLLRLSALECLTSLADGLAYYALC